VSSSLDKSVKLWDFYQGKLLKTYQTDFPITNLAYNKVNDLVAISSSDLSITILNPKAELKRVRNFPGAAQNKINDLCFSQPDSKWLISCSMDCCIRVWDIITGTLVDWIKFKNAPLSIDFSPSGEFLATSHLNSKAVFLWSNRAFFQHIVIQKVPTQPKSIDLPHLLTTESQKISHKDFYDPLQDQSLTKADPTPEDKPSDKSYI
jgi:U3 small nucleolar RNA-associated protein 21